MAKFPIEHKGTTFPEPMVPDEKVNMGERAKGRRMKTDYTIWNVYNPPVLRDRLHEVAESDYRHPADYFIRSLNSLVTVKKQSLKEGTKGQQQRDVLAEQLKQQPGVKEPYALATWQVQQKKKSLQKQDLAKEGNEAKLNDKVFKKDTHKDNMAHWCPTHRRWEVSVNKLMKSDEFLGVSIEEVLRVNKPIYNPMNVNIIDLNSKIKDIVKSVDIAIKEIGKDG